MVFLLSIEMFILFLILALNIYKSSFNHKSFSIHCHETDLNQSKTSNNIVNHEVTIYLLNHKVVCGAQ